MDSGNSSPHSPSPSFEDQPSLLLPPTSNKVKFMVSYNGKIQPRSHDNLLSYIGGETKILSVDRSVKFSTIHSKLASLTSLDNDVSDGGFSFKYQLPGEDLDSLISVTNDDDLEHMMHEYDRMFKASPNKPVRLRLFLFSLREREQKQPPWSAAGAGAGSGFSSLSSDQLKAGPDHEPDRVSEFSGSVDHLNQNAAVLNTPVHNNVDYLFGLDKVPGPVHVPVHLLSEQKAVDEPELLQELNRLKIAALEFQQQKSALKPPENYDNFGGTYIQPSSPANIPANVQIPAGYWHQNQQLQQPPQQFHHQTPVYVMHAPPQGNIYAPPQGNIYAPPQVNGQIQQNQGFYMMQQPVYSIPAVSATAAQVMPGMTGQVAYDSVTGRQIYYTAAAQGGVVTTSFSGMSAVATGGGGGDGKVVQVVAPPSSGV